MLHALYQHPEIEKTLAEATAVLGRDVRELDEENIISSTVSTQLCIYVAGVGVSRALMAEGAIPHAVAGLSVGAYAAATVCGALDFADGVRLVQLRASLMEQSFTTGYGLAAIVGLDETTVSELVAQVATKEAPVYVANLNAPRQIVVAGSLAGIDDVVERAHAAGCQKAERLAVRVPSHCPLLQGVAERLQKEIATLPHAVVRMLYVTNRRARPTRSLEQIRDDVATNIAHPVRWHDSTEVLIAMGTTVFVEVDPGRVLSSLASVAFPDVPALATSASALDLVVERVRGAGE
jgi:malonate decarboxylase epsilon subunit